MNNSMYYLACGQGKPLVLIHGWAMDSLVWSFFIEEFSPDYTIIAVDLRGHGQSGSLPGPYNLKTFALDLLDLLKDPALKDATVIGWSMGVSAVLKMFEYAAPAVDSLVLISGTPSLVARRDYPHGMPRGEVSSLLRSIKKEYVPGMAGFYKLMFQGDDVQHPHREKIYALAADTGRAPRQEVACEALLSMQQEDLRPCLKKIHAPVLLIHGSHDQICLPGASRYMAEQIPSASLHILDSVGHVPFLTAAEDVHREVKKFIRFRQ
jgi:pimeloyl-ACP methyl ester esterase